LSSSGPRPHFDDLEYNSIVRISPDLKTRTVLVKGDRLIWPDSYSISRDGYLYISKLAE
jgi:hypothetical protein